MFPLAVWNEDRTWNFPGFCSGIAEKGSYAYVSTDEGKTFKQLGCAQIQNRSFDENMILEMKDGSLRMFVRRLLKAKILLGGCDDKIIEIATECGYENASYLSEVFKKKTRMTPSQYRNQYRSKFLR